MRILSWNVNGLRSVLEKGFHQTLAPLAWDALCLQETRLPNETAAALDWEIPTKAFHEAEKKGYSGTAILSQKPFLKAFPLDQEANLGKEGRVLVAEYEQFFLVSVYTPNSQNELRRLDYRCCEWEPLFRKAIQKLMNQKPIILCGDLNVAHQEIDLARPKANRRNAGFTDEERAEFDKLLDLGLVDSFRALHPDEPDHYTWWSFRGRARQNNVGWRIDYILVSEELMPKVSAATIYPSLKGSDHCPIGLDIKF